MFQRNALKSALLFITLAFAGNIFAKPSKGRGLPEAGKAASEAIDHGKQAVEAAATAAKETAIAASSATTAQMQKIRRGLLATAERRALLRTTTKTVGVVVGKIAAAYLKHWVVGVGNLITGQGWDMKKSKPAAWGLKYDVTKDGEEEHYGLVNNKLGVDTVVGYSISETVGACFALAFDAVMDKLQPTDKVDAQAKVVETLVLSIVGSAIETGGAFVGFEHKYGQFLVGKPFIGANGDQKGDNAKHHQKVIAAILSILIRSTKDGAFTKLVGEKSLARPALENLQKIAGFIDADSVQWINHQGKGCLGAKKLINGSICKTVTAMMDGRIIANTGKKAKWNTFMKSLVGAWLSPFLAPMVDATFKTVADQAEFCSDTNLRNAPTK